MSEYPKWVLLHESQVSRNEDDGPARAWSKHWPVDRVHRNRVNGEVGVLVLSHEEEIEAGRDINVEQDS